jgi:hypothetical protein
MMIVMLSKAKHLGLPIQKELEILRFAQNGIMT